MPELSTKNLLVYLNLLFLCLFILVIKSSTEGRKNIQEENLLEVIYRREGEGEIHGGEFT